MNIVLKSLKTFGTAGLVVFILYKAWDYFTPSRPPYPLAKREIAREVCKTIAQDIRLHKDNIYTIKVFTFEKDPYGYFTNDLRRELNYLGTFDIYDKSFNEKLRDLLRLRHKPIGDEYFILEKFGGKNIDGAICGKIHTFEIVDDEVRIDVEVYFLDLRTGEELLSKRYMKTEQIPEDLARETSAPHKKKTFFSFLKYFIIWWIPVMLLPIILFKFVLHTVEKNSNKANAVALSIFTIFDILWMLLIFAPTYSGIFMWIILIGGTILAFLYNVAIMSFAVKLQE